ncbi:MAG: hypothetical protein CMK32_08140 [Porticoccaceae bacterium]|nr:hypothetical protein [Porticoccaceae bacterium]
MSSSTDWRQTALEHGKEMGKIFNWARLGAVEDMQEQWREQQLNREAESSAARRQFVSPDVQMQSQADEEMRQTILGDVNNPPAIIMPQQQSSNLGTVAALAAATLGLGGAAGYILADKSSDSTQPPAVQRSVDDESVSIGLGRIEDFLK